jgi:penicillin-binding protein 1C
LKKVLEEIVLYIGASMLVLIISALILVPVIKFENDFSPVVFSKEGQLLGAKIASDEQWRFPAPASIPRKFEQAILTYEDNRFYYHNGVDIIRLIKALYDNLQSRSIESGASTITMQLARISRSNPNRTIGNKVLEMLMAVKTELLWSKSRILKSYAANAPFGGNTVGLETASWRYYNKKANYLSWAEAATLAILPNSPGLIHPGRQRMALLKKRNFLLNKLNTRGIISALELELALLETLPDKPYPIPQGSLHLVEYLGRKEFNGRNTTIDQQLQEGVRRIADAYYDRYRQNGVYNMAILVVENNSGYVRAYIGNAGEGGEKGHEFFIDMIQRGRSTGSILKPLLYAYGLDEGLITPRQLLPDIPGNISGYRPRNFTREFEGAVSAEKALIRSLNVPFVYLLQQYSIDKFLYQLQDLGFENINRSAEYYGLPLILGGADATLWQLVSVYSSMARTLMAYNDSNGQYFLRNFRQPGFEIRVNNDNNDKIGHPAFLSAGSIWQTFTAMSHVERPTESGLWEYYNNPRKIAWKTGTSFGFKDAWSIGVSSTYTVGVWVGNATGEGRNGLIGVRKAAPVLFSVFDLLPNSPWFEEPDDLKYLEICRESGFPASNNCLKRDTITVPNNSDHHTVCPYHKIVLTDTMGTWRLTDKCSNEIPGIAESYMVLPPLMEYYYRQKHPDYRNLPDFHPSCSSIADQQVPMAFIYPAVPSKLQIPVEFSGAEGRVVFRIAHREPDKKVFWYLDNDYISETVEFHEIELNRPPGEYILVAVDEDGYILSQRLSILD